METIMTRKTDQERLLAKDLRDAWELWWYHISRFSKDSPDYLQLGELRRKITALADPGRYDRGSLAVWFKGEVMIHYRRDDRHMDTIPLEPERIRQIEDLLRTFSEERRAEYVATLSIRNPILDDGKFWEWKQAHSNSMGGNFSERCYSDFGLEVVKQLEAFMGRKPKYKGASERAIYWKWLIEFFEDEGNAGVATDWLKDQSLEASYEVKFSNEKHYVCIKIKW
jgi:hypothetical protein